MENPKRREMKSFQESGQRNLEYQKCVQETHIHWTQFDLDLIRCIRDKHPIIYMNVNDLGGLQRAGKIKKAWHEIRAEFKDLTVSDIKNRWHNLRNSYLKAKVQYGSNIPTNSKFYGGMLGFLDTEINFLELEKNMNAKAGSDSNLSQEVDAGYYNIKQLIHEEVDISDDDIKKETSDDDYQYAPEEEDHAVDYNSKATEDDELDKGDKKWTEEELLNATRLTQEMIQELIHIKSKNYYSKPVDADYN